MVRKLTRREFNAALGAVGEGDYDPTLYGNGLVAFSKFTPPSP